jgi:hypothetical protein
MADKSFADLLASVLDGWEKFFKFLALIFFVCLFAFGLVWGILLILPSDSQVKIGSGSTSFLISTPTKNGNKYVVVIAPQGWQSADIPIKSQEFVTIEPGGKVNIDLSGLNEGLEARRQAEKWVADHFPKSQIDEFGPEHFFRDEDLKRMQLTWSWTGPEGAKNMRAANPSRRKREFCQSEGYGALLAAITSAVPPTRDEAFFVGGGRTIQAERDGELQFAVNDIWNDVDAKTGKPTSFPDMFVVDNIGVFYAKVTVTTKDPKLFNVSTQLKARLECQKAPPSDSAETAVRVSQARRP